MKGIKTFSLLVALILASGLAFAAVTDIKVQMATKDPATWKAISAKGVVRFGIEKATRSTLAYEYVQFSQTKGLAPNTEYTLVYYGNNEVNDIWPYVACIGVAKTNSLGTLNNNMITGHFEWTPMIDDGVAQKFWVVPSSDVDCSAGLFVAWNPSNYLFEQKTI